MGNLKVKVVPIVKRLVGPVHRTFERDWISWMFVEEWWPSDHSTYKISHIIKKINGDMPLVRRQ